MNINNISSQIVALQNTGCTQEVADKIAADSVKFFTAKTKCLPLRHKYNRDCPRTVIRTHTACVYMLQRKGGIVLLGTGTSSKVGRVIVVHDDGRVTLEKGRVLFNKIEQAIAVNAALKQYDSPYIDKAAWLTFKYMSDKEDGGCWGDQAEYARCLLVQEEILAFDAEDERMLDLPIRQQLAILADIAEGLAILHADLKAHNDVKAANFRVRHLPEQTGLKRHQGVLSDSDFMKPIGEARTQGSPYWIAPEQYLDSGTSSAAQDMWAFGLSMYQILNSWGTTQLDLMPPFIRKCGFKTKDINVFAARLLQVTDEDLTEDLLFPEGWSLLPERSPEFERIIRACLSLKPDLRPDARSIAKALRALANSVGEES